MIFVIQNIINSLESQFKGKRIWLPLCVHQYFVILVGNCKKVTSFIILSEMLLFRFVISLYQRAIATAGLEFVSDVLWNSYITWEKASGSLKNIIPIYDQILKIPTRQYGSYILRCAISYY